MSSEVKSMTSVADAGPSVDAELTERQADSLERMFSTEVISTISTEKVIVMDELDTPRPEPDEDEPAPRPEDEPESEPDNNPDTGTQR